MMKIHFLLIILLSSITIIQSQDHTNFFDLNKTNYNITTELFWLNDNSVSYEEGFTEYYNALYYEPKYKQFFIANKIEETNITIESLLPDLYTNNSEKIYLLNRDPSDRNYALTTKKYAQYHRSYYQYKGSLSFNQRVYILDRKIYIVTIRPMKYQNIATTDFIKFSDHIIKNSELSLLTNILIDLETPLVPIISTNQYTDVFEFSYSNNQGVFHNDWDFFFK